MCPHVRVVVAELRLEGPHLVEPGRGRPAAVGELRRPIALCRFYLPDQPLLVARPRRRRTARTAKPSPIGIGPWWLPACFQVELQQVVDDLEVGHESDDLPSKRLYVFERAGVPKHLRPLVGGKVNPDLIDRNWADILRVAATSGALSIARTAAMMPWWRGIPRIRTR